MTISSVAWYLDALSPHILQNVKGRGTTNQGSGWPGTGWGQEDKRNAGSGKRPHPDYPTQLTQLLASRLAALVCHHQIASRMREVLPSTKEVIPPGTSEPPATAYGDLSNVSRAECGSSKALSWSPRSNGANEGPSDEPFPAPVSSGRETLDD